MQLNGLSRRRMMAGLGGVVAGASLPLRGGATGFDGLHKEVAKTVRKIASGKPINLRLLLPNGSGGNLDPVIAEFQTLTGVKVISDETHVDEINTELTLGALSNQQHYDVALPATFGLPDLVASGTILPLSELARKYEPPGFREGILYDVGDSFDGEIYGFQADGDAYVMFYNKAMMQAPSARAQYEDRFGHALELPETWDDLDQQMAFFHNPGKGQFGGLLFRTQGYLAWEWWVRFHAKGLWPLAPDLTPQVASDAGLEALEAMIRSQESLAPEATELGLFENWERFSKGDIYCNIGWGGSQKFFNDEHSAIRGNLVFGPTPGGFVDGQLLVAPYFNWGWNYVIAKNSANAEIAYLFALFASSPAMSTLAVRQDDGFFDPFRPEHYEDEGIKTAYSEPFLKVHRDSLEAAIPDLYLKDQAEYFRVLNEWLFRALAGDVSPEVALDRVAQRWTLIANRSDRKVQQERWSRLRDKYPPAARNLLRDLN